MSEETQPPKASRSFSKRVLLMNLAFAWGLLFYAVAKGHGPSMATPVFAMIVFLYGTYTGVGHLDYRKVLDTLGPNDAKS